MNEQYCRAFAGRLVIQFDVVYASRGHQKRYFRPSWISRALLLAEMIRPNDPGLVIGPVAALTGDPPGTATAFRSLIGFARFT